MTRTVSLKEGISDVTRRAHNKSALILKTSEAGCAVSLSSRWPFTPGLVWPRSVLWAQTWSWSQEEAPRCSTGSPSPPCWQDAAAAAASPACSASTWRRTMAGSRAPATTTSCVLLKTPRASRGPTSQWDPEIDHWRGQGPHPGARGLIQGPGQIFHRSCCRFTTFLCLHSLFGITTYSHLTDFF